MNFEDEEAYLRRRYSLVDGNSSIEARCCRQVMTFMLCVFTSVSPPCFRHQYHYLLDSKMSHSNRKLELGQLFGLWL